MAQLVRTQNWEPRISHSRSGGAPYDAIAKGMLGLDDAEATAQTLANMKSDEHAALLGENAACGNVRQYLAAGYGLCDGQARQMQQGLPVVVREGRHLQLFCGLRACAICGAA